MSGIRKILILEYKKENTHVICQTRWLEMEDKKMWKGITQLITFTKGMYISVIALKTGYNYPF